MQDSGTILEALPIPGLVILGDLETFPGKVLYMLLIPSRSEGSISVNHGSTFSFSLSSLPEAGCRHGATKVVCGDDHNIILCGGRQ